MLDLYSNLQAFLTGFFFGFILSVPVGPVNLTIMNEGARRGLAWALLIGFGATAMEVLYCGLAFTGFASFFEGEVVNAALELFSFVFMLYLGIRFLTARKIESVVSVEEKIEKKFKPHSAFATGFVRVMGNPGVFLFWIVLAAMFHRHHWVAPTLVGAAFCVSGVGTGTGLWFCGLSYGASRRHGKLNEHTLLRMEHFSGICLLLLAVVQGGYIVWKMTRHKL
jgi:threonine/homoserine/homoserine lactone efflux protein